MDEVEELTAPQTAAEIIDDQIVIDEHEEDDQIEDDLDEEPEVIADLARLCNDDKKLNAIGEVMLGALCGDEIISRDEIDAAKLKSIVETGDVNEKLKKLDDFYATGGDIKTVDDRMGGICVRVKESN